MGTWNFAYDHLNRLSTAVETVAPANNSGSDYVGQNLCMFYDHFGNRTESSFQTTTCTVPNPTVIYGGSKNQITNKLYTYDAAGDVTFDGNNWYSYDEDGRLCSVQTSPTSGVTAYGYIYDAEGRRVAKGTIAVTSTPLVCNPDTTTNGFQLTESYVLDQSGQELTMLDQNGKPQRTNVFAGSQLIATYDSTNLHFQLTDPLGTRRMQVSTAGVVEGTFQSLPFGDKPTSSGGDATPLHYTGKERDSESGLDYFGARYYGSSMGRFMSPDEPFVDQSPGDPQSWNLYSYVRNNPLSNVDPDGQDCVTNNGDGTATINSGDCSGKDSNNEYYYNCDGCLMGTTSANLTSDGGLALYNANSNTISTISGYGYTAGSTGGFDPGSLAAGVFGAQSASTWNNAAGVVNAAGSIEMGIMAPWAAAGAGCLSGDSGGKCAANMALSVLPEVGELRAGATLLKEAAVAGKGAEILQKAGGAAQAVKEFEAILAVSEQIDGAVRVKTLSDGSKAVLYESSSGSGTTISLQDASGHTNTKIRY